MGPIPGIPQGAIVKFTLAEMLRVKRESRAHRAAQTVAEKLRVPEQLRERDRSIRTATPSSGGRRTNNNSADTAHLRFRDQSRCHRRHPEPNPASPLNSRDSSEPTKRYAL